MYFGSLNVSFLDEMAKQHQGSDERSRSEKIRESATGAGVVRHVLPRESQASIIAFRCNSMIIKV